MIGVYVCLYMHSYMFVYICAYVCVRWLRAEIAVGGV